MATFFSWLSKIFITSLMEVLSKYAFDIYQWIVRKEEIKKDAEKSVDPLKKAETGEEIDKATDPALNGF